MATGVNMDKGQEMGGRNGEEQVKQMGRRGRRRDGIYIFQHTNKCR